MHITLNPFRTRILAKYLTAAITQIDFPSLAEEKHFGDFTAQIEQDNLQEEDFEEEGYVLADSFLLPLFAPIAKVGTCQSALHVPADASSSGKVT